MMSILSILKNSASTKGLFRRLLLISSLFIFNGICNAQVSETQIQQQEKIGTVTGRVADENREVIANAEVTIMAARCDCKKCVCDKEDPCCCCPKTKAKTNESGDYVFEGSPGDYIVEVKVGDSKVVKEITVEKDTYIKLNDIFVAGPPN